MAFAPNMLDLVREAATMWPEEWAKAKTPEDDGSFIKIVARLLHDEDARFGLNGKRGTNEISLDAVSYVTPDCSGAGGVEIIDVILAHTAPQAQPAWNDVTQATIDAGTIGKFIEPPALPGDEPPPPPDPDPDPGPPPPDPGPPDPYPGSPGNEFTYFRHDHEAFFKGEVAPHQVFDELIIKTRQEAGLPIEEQHFWKYRALAFWRYNNQTLIRRQSSQTHDSAVAFWPNERSFMDLKTRLLEVWKGDTPPPPPPGVPVPLPSLLDLPPEQRVGNFLYNAGIYFPPAAAVKGQDAFRAACQWSKDNGYKLILVNWEQTDWAPARGYPRQWTGPQQHNFRTDAGIQVFIRMLQIAQTEYGLLPVVGLFEQDTVKTRDWSRIDNMARKYIPQMNDWCVAYWDTWEINEVLGGADHRRFEAIIDRYATKPHGLHFASNFFPEDNRAYWRDMQSDLVWDQYGFQASRDDIVTQTRRRVDLLRDADRPIRTVMAEGSIWGPSPWMDGPGHSLTEAAARGKAGTDNGAVARLNG